MDYIKNRKIAVVDFGGQYAHLIGSRLRRLGAYCEIVSPDSFTAVEAKEHYAGIVFSGGPSSVYDENAPVSEPALLDTGLPVLGICYGHQLMMQQAGGRVSPAKSREYGPARIRLAIPDGIFGGEKTTEEPTVWMSHGDEVDELPPGFVVMGSTEDCSYAAVANLEKRLYGVQFHPEVKDTEHGDAYLGNFIKICGLENTWSLEFFLEEEMAKIRRTVGDRKVFMLLSGGVDSTVAFTLLGKALPAENLRALFVDTGFMRYREMDEVKKALSQFGSLLDAEDFSGLYHERLDGVFDPEEKRKIIGELFVDVLEQSSSKFGLDPSEWFLGQGTIYPDTIESGATKNSQKIKTHHNRVERIQRLIDAGRVVEPIRDLYKDEVRRLGKLLGLEESLINRHPFPGPGLAVRILCTGEETQDPILHAGTVEGFDMYISERFREDSAALTTGQELLKRIREYELSPVILPVRSVGVQGDKRSYAHPVALFSKNESFPGWDILGDIARRIPNRFPDFNRVLLCTGSRYDIQNHRIRPIHNAHLTRERVDLLRAADRIVTEFLHEKKIYNEIWQFPVVLVPVNIHNPEQEDDTGDRTGAAESIILRPVNSLDAMTATFYRMPQKQMHELTLRILSLVRVDAVFYDLTSKPPGTIEWE